MQKKKKKKSELTLQESLKTCPSVKVNVDDEIKNLKMLEIIYKTRKQSIRLHSWKRIRVSVLDQRYQ